MLELSKEVASLFCMVGHLNLRGIKPIHCKWQRVTQVDVSLETSGLLSVSSVERPTRSLTESVYVGTNAT